MKTLFGMTLAFIILSGCTTLRINKEKADLHVKLGISQFESSNYPLALAEFLQAEELDPDNPVVHNNLGLTYFMREKLELAEKHLRTAVSLQPRYTDARNNLARVLIERKKFSEAEKELNTVLQDLTYPNSEKAYINQGLNYFSQKKYSAAKDAFSKAIEQQQDNCVANTYYGRSLFEMSEYQRAINAFDRAIGFCQKTMFDEPHYYSALAFYRLGEKNKSIIRFEETVKLYPNGQYQEKSRAMLDIIRKAQ